MIRATWVLIRLALLSIVIMAGIYAWQIAKTVTSSAVDVAENSADVIVVLTGGQNRIAEGFMLLDKKAAAHLYVSGTHPNTVVQAMVDTLPKKVHRDVLECCVTLDNTAKDTKGNATVTGEWLVVHEKTSIILVTSAYHMPRALAEFKHVVPNIQIRPHSVVPSTATRVFTLNDLPPWRVLLKEAVKYWVILIQNEWVSVVS